MLKYCKMPIKHFKLRVIFSLAAILSLFLYQASFSNSQYMAYEGNLFDSNGNPLTGKFNMRFAIVKTENNYSTIVWGPETHDSVNVSKGWFSVLLGEKLAINKSIFENQQLYLRIEIANPPNSTNYEILSPSNLIVSVGRAFRAETAVTVPDASITSVKIAPGSITKEALATTNQPSNNQYLRWRNGSLEWATVSGGGSTEADEITITTNSYGSLEVKNLGITTTKIATSAVTSDKLASNAALLSIASLEAPVRLKGHVDLKPGNNIILSQSGQTIEITSTASSTAGTITSVTAGKGLSGGGSSGAVTLDAVVDFSTITIESNTIKVNQGGISTNEIANGSITTNKIADASITSSKLSSNINISTTGIITANSIYGSFYGDGSKLINITSESLSLPTAEIFIGSNINKAIPRTLFGHVTVDAFGLTTINDGAITTTKIAPQSITNEALKIGEFINILRVGTLESLEVKGPFKSSSEVVLTPSQITTISSNLIDSSLLKKVIIKVKSSGGNLNVDNIDNGIDGQIIILKGVDEIDKIVLTTLGNIRLSGTVSFTLGKHDSITLAFDKDESIWYEISRSDN